MTYVGPLENSRVRDSRVSVLLPCTDRSHALLSRVIPSLHAQTLPDWELIVVSLGERNTRMRAAVESVSDSRIVYDEVALPGDVDSASAHHDGACRARALNRAQELATGAALCLLDEDSTYLPGHLQECLDAVTDHPTALVHGPVESRDRNTGDTHVDGADRVMSISVCFGRHWRNMPFPADGTEFPEDAKWGAMDRAGATRLARASPTVVTYGGDTTGRIRVSMPSLPPTERLHELVDTIASTRRLSNHGPVTAELEQELARYLGVPHVVTAASGDAALAMAMIYAASGTDDRTEVVLPSYTFPSTVNAVVRAGLTPVFCDIDPDSLCASAATMAPHIGERTLALVPVYAHGAPPDMPELESLADDAGAMLISDAAAALGATVGGRNAGTFGAMEMFSLSSTKVLTAGEGGFLSVQSDTAVARLREIGRYGLDDYFSCVAVGVNGRLAEFSAGLALTGIDYLADWLAARRRTAALYEEGLSGVPGLRVIPHRIADRLGTAKDVVLVVDSVQMRDQLAERLLRNRIETRPYFRPVHVMAPFKHLVGAPLDVTEELADRMLSLPITNELPDESVAHVVSVLRHEIDRLG